jgi:hypothetical protein
VSFTHIVNASWTHYWWTAAALARTQNDVGRQAEVIRGLLDWCLHERQLHHFSWAGETSPPRRCQRRSSGPWWRICRSCMVRLGLAVAHLVMSTSLGATRSMVGTARMTLHL